MTRAIAVVFVAVALALICGCARSTDTLDAGKLNALIDEGNRTLNEKGRAFGVAVGKYLQGDRTAAPTVRAAHREWRQELTDVRQRVHEWDRPAGADARQLHASYDVFLDEQSKTLHKLSEVVALVENTQALADKQPRILALIKEATEAEKEPLNALHHAQEQFAAAYKLRWKERATTP